jgi:hypothetical protein
LDFYDGTEKECAEQYYEQTYGGNKWAINNKHILVFLKKAKHQTLPNQNVNIAT